MLRILVVDDTPAFMPLVIHELADLRQPLSITCAYSGQEALTQASCLAPDLVLLDISLPDINGLEIARQMKAAPHPPVVVVLSMHTLTGYQTAGRAVGVDGFVAKDDLDTQLIPLLTTLLCTPPPLHSPGDCLSAHDVVR